MHNGKEAQLKIGQMYQAIQAFESIVIYNMYVSLSLPLNMILWSLERTQMWTP